MGGEGQSRLVLGRIGKKSRKERQGTRIGNACLGFPKFLPSLQRRKNRRPKGIWWWEKQECRILPRENKLFCAGGKKSQKEGKKNLMKPPSSNHPFSSKQLLGIAACGAGGRREFLIPLLDIGNNYHWGSSMQPTHYNLASILFKIKLALIKN